MQHIEKQGMLSQGFQDRNAFVKNIRQAGEAFCCPVFEDDPANKITFYKQKVPGNKGKVIRRGEVFVLQTQKGSQHAVLVQKIRQPVQDNVFKPQVPVVDVAEDK